MFIAWNRWPAVQFNPGDGFAGHTHQQAAPQVTVTSWLPPLGTHSPIVGSQVDDANDEQSPQLPPEPSEPQSLAAQRTGEVEMHDPLSHSRPLPHVPQLPPQP